MTRSGFSSGSRWPLCAVLALMLTGVSHAQNVSDDQPAWRIQGFGTVGMARASSHEAEFVRNLAQPHGTRGNWTAKTDSLFGLQANWQLTPEWEAVIQGLSRYNTHGNYRPELSWAFLRWHPTSDLNVRVGRLGTDFYMLADSQFIGYAALPVRPSVDYFSSVPMSYIDGADVSWSFPAAAGIIRTKLFAGWSPESLPLADRQWNIRGSFMRGAHVEYHRGPWSLRAGHAELRLNGNLPIDDLTAALRATGSSSAQEAAHHLDTNNKTADFSSLGIVYDDGPLTVHVMANRVHQETDAFQNTRSTHALIGYRLGDWTPYAGYSRSYGTPRRDRASLPAGVGLDGLTAAYQSVLADGHSNQTTQTVGVRWDFLPNRSLKAQLDTIQGSAGSIFPFRNETADWNGRTRVVSLALDFIF